MKTMKIIFLVNLLLLSLCVTGCRRNPGGVWEDTKSAGRHMKRGISTLGGKHGDSRQVNSRDEFMCYEGDPQGGNGQPQGYDYVPLSDDPNYGEIGMTDSAHRPPRESPGEPGSSIPGLEAFKDPSTDPRLSPIFKNVQFPYNSSLIKGDENLTIIRNVSDYMKSHPRTYVFLEGHCDERGPEQYNFALGSYRSNGVRNLLIDNGVNPDNIFTISYGKERPLIMGGDEGSHQQNRRAEFKVYEK